MRLLTLLATFLALTNLSAAFAAGPQVTTKQLADNVSLLLNLLTLKVWYVWVRDLLSEQVTELRSTPGQGSSACPNSPQRKSVVSPKIQRL